MPKPARGARLGAGPAHEKLMLRGLAASLIRDERIRTTLAKADRLAPIADRLITLGKDGGVSARRRALSLVEDRDLVHKLFAEIAPRYRERNGGYTRVLKLGPRKGDAAPMALIELIEGEVSEAAPAEEPKRRRGLRRGRRKAKAEGEAPEAEETPEVEPAEVAPAEAEAEEQPIVAADSDDTGEPEADRAVADEETGMAEAPEGPSEEKP